VGDNGVTSATAIDALAKPAVGQISAPEPHQQTKARTHLIESSNASFRDMLARFNRPTKRASKTQQMLEVTLDIFLARKRLQSPR
jgi:hypothetical protein